MKIISIFLILILLTGCSKTNINDEIEETASSVTTPIEPYNLYVNTNYFLEKYEPKEGLYLGVYLENTSKETITNFEEIVNSSHNVYSYNLNLNDQVPLSFILSCYAKDKIPFLNILPPENEDDIFNIDILKNLAKSLGNLNIPIFVNLYENPHLNNYNEENYLKFFKQAKIYFEMYAKNVALIWSINSENVYNINKYYPGDNYVDWVGLNIYETINENNEIKKVLTELDYFYNNFQNNKPICINLGISHFSDQTLDYLINEKLEELTRFYETIPEKYPKVKLINYLNYSNFEVSNVKNNFSIVDNKKITNTYKSLTENIILQKLLTTSSENQEVEGIKKLNFLAYKQKDTFLINEDNLDILMYNKKVENFNKSNFEIIKINGENYYNLSQISDYYNFKIEVNENNKILILK